MLDRERRRKLMDKETMIKLLYLCLGADTPGETTVEFRADTDGTVGITIRDYVSDDYCIEKDSYTRGVFGNGKAVWTHRKAIWTHGTRQTTLYEVIKDLEDMQMLNIEPPLEPPERDDQERINRLYDMREAEIRMGAFLEEYEGLFPDEIKNFLQDVRERVWEAEDEIEED